MSKLSNQDIETLKMISESIKQNQRFPTIRELVKIGQERYGLRGVGSFQSRLQKLVEMGYLRKTGTDRARNYELVALPSAETVPIVLPCIQQGQVAYRYTGDINRQLCIQPGDILIAAPDDGRSRLIVDKYGHVHPRYLGYGYCAEESVIAMIRDVQTEVA